MPGKFEDQQFRNLYDMEKLTCSFLDKSLTDESSFEYNDRLDFVMVLANTRGDQHIKIYGIVQQEPSEFHLLRQDASVIELLHASYSTNS